MKPHKHAELIKAWADGGQLQYKPTKSDTWSNIPFASWDQDGEYRIKPEPPKEEEPQYLYAYRHVDTSKIMMSPTFLRDTSDWNYMGKVEVIK